jgi:hypothetical protein
MTYFPPSSSVASATGPGSELITGPKTLRIYQSPQPGPQGISTLRETWAVAGSGTYSVNNETEYQLTTTASGTDEVEFSTRDVCRFYPGQAAEVGLAVRSPDAMTGNQEVTFGLDDSENGVGFGRNATGWFAWVRSNSSITRVQSSAWNVDQLDGNGSSGLTLDGTTTTRFVVEFSSSFLGLINFYVYAWDSSTYQMQRVLVHRWAPVSGSLESNPYGPIRVHLDNAATATARDFFVSELWFATVGDVPDKIVRDIFGFRLNQTPSTTTIPAVTWRRKTGNRNLRSRTSITGFEYIISGADLIVTVREGHSLTAASWGSPQVPVTETSLEQDTSATAFTGGANRAQGFFGAGSGVKDFLNPIPIPNTTDEVGLIMRTISGTATRVDIFLRGIEEW